MRRPVMLVALVALWIWTGLATWSSLAFYADNLRNRDFTAFYRSAETWTANGDLYDVEGIPNVNINPPHVSVLMFVPMLLWPLATASVVWFVMQAAAGAMAIAMIRREVQMPAQRFAWFLGMFLASCAVQHHWWEGQVTGFLLLLSTIAWRAARHDRRATAGWTAAAISVKPWLACWLPAVTRGRWLWTMAIGLAAIGAGIATLGIASWLEWEEAVRTKAVRPMVVNLSVLAAIARYVRMPLVNDSGGWPYDQPLWVLVSILVVVLSWRVRSASTDRAWLVFGLAGILVSPLGWAYYLVAVTGPLAAWGETHKWPWPAVVAGAFLMPTRQLMTQLTITSGWLGGSIAFLGVVLLWGTALWWPAAAPPPPARNLAR